MTIEEILTKANDARENWDALGLSAWKDSEGLEEYVEHDADIVRDGHEFVLTVEGVRHAIHLEYGRFVVSDAGLFGEGRPGWHLIKETTEPWRFWEWYVGRQGPAEFMEHDDDTPREAIGAYIDGMPEFFGSHTDEERELIAGKLVEYIEEVTS